jgi:hypothetical protein
MEGNYDNSDNAVVSCTGSSCSFTPPQGQGTFWYWAVSTYGDTSAKYSMTYKHDSGAPSVSLSPSGTLGGGGWYRSNVTVTGSGSDSVSGLAGVSLSCGSNPCTITADGTHTITATATDNAGNSASTSVTVRKDTTPPGITFSPSGTAGSGGWYRSSVTLSASGSDAHSGLSSLTLSCGSNPCTLSAQGSTTVTANASDVAGNTASNSTTIRIDSVPPNASLSPSGTLGLNGWYVSNVTVTTSGTDATSGLASVQTRLNGGAWGGNSVTINTDGTHTVEGRAYDVAGNVSSTVSTTIRRDTVPPTASLVIPAPNGANGWFVTNPTVSASGSDATSGLAASQVRVNGGAWQSSAVVSGDGTHTIEGRAQDNAGHWSSTVSTTVRVDTTPPGVSASIPAPNGQNGWYVSPVTVTAQGDDATSGIASREVRLGSGAWQANSLTVNTDGNHTVTVRTTDNAGLSSTTTVNIPYDATAPAASLNLPAPDGANGWYISPVSVSTNGSDATSGIASTSVRVNGGAWQSTASISTDGIHTVEGQSRDNAGNYSSVPSATVRIDQTPPIVSPSYPAPDGLNGWHVSNVTISALASDATSGVASRQVTLDGSTWVNNDTTITTDGIYTVTVRSTDNAGLSNTAFATIRRDATPPVISGLDVSGAAGNNGWYRSDVNVAGLATDATSGISLIEVNGQPSLSFSDGVHSVTVRAVDEAGNESLQTLTVQVDTTPPDLTPQIDTPSGQNGWHVTAVQVDASADDATSGVESVRVRINNGAWQSLPLTLDQDGVYTVEYEVTDRAGNTTTRTETVQVDTTPPTADVVSPAVTGNNGWYIDNPSMSVDASDNLSGVQSRLIRVNNGAWQTPPVQLPEGVNSVDVMAIDEAGNLSDIVGYTFLVDLTPPDLSPEPSTPDGTNGWYHEEAVLNAIANDVLSGLADVRVRVDGGAWQPLPVTLTDEGIYTVDIEAEDEAGLITSRTLTISIDRTAPTIDPAIPAPDGNNNWYVSPFDVDYTTTDNLSGVDETQWRVNGGAWQNGTPRLDAEGEVVLDIRSQDTAGNERIRRYTFYLDQSLPTGEITLTGEEGLEQWYRSPVEAVLTGEDAVSGVGDTRIMGVSTQQNGEFSINSVSSVIATEGWHTLTGEVEDNAGWVRELSRSFGIDMTLPEGGFDELPDLLSGTVTLTGEAKDSLSGLQSLEISFSMGYQWQELTADQDRWSYEWETTQTNGGEKRIYLRLTDKAGNTYTTSVNVLVSNALPKAAITESWVITESGIVNITPGDLPIRRVCLTIQDPADASRKVEWCGESVNDIPNPVKWDGKFADGTTAGPGQYSVTVLVTDIASRTVSASGTVIIPEPTATPTIPPVIPESGGNMPTVPFVPTATPTMTPTPTPTETPVEVEEEQPTATPPAVSMVLPTPQPTIAFKPPKFEAQAVVEVVRRTLWPFLTLLGLAAALGYSAVRDERPKAIRKLAERMEKIIQFKQEVD